MSDEITRLTKELSQLSIKRSKIIADLQKVDAKHNSIEQELYRAKRNKESVLSGKDVKGNSLFIGDNVTTLTKGKYYERIATVIRVEPDNHIDIEYKTSKKQTWRAGHNLLKLP